MKRPSHSIPVTIGLVMIGFGVHQLTNSNKWVSYIPKPVKAIVPIEPEIIVKTHALGNLSLGLLYVLLHKNGMVRWSVAGWWFNVMLLCGNHNWKEGLRDLPIFITSYMFASRSNKSIIKNDDEKTYSH